MPMNAFAITRLAMFGALLLFAVVALGLSANLVSKYNSVSYYTGWTGGNLGIAVSVLTLVSVVPLIVLGVVNRLSLVAVELVVFGILWVLWLSAAALTTSEGTINSCNFGSYSYYDYYYSSSVISDAESLCHQYQGFQAASWLAWLVVTSYLIILVVIAIMAQVKGHDAVWIKPSTDLTFNPAPAGNKQQHMMAPSSYGSTPYGVTPAVTPNVTGYPSGYAGSPVMQQQPPIMQQNSGFIPQSQPSNTPGMAYV